MGKAVAVSTSVLTLLAASRCCTAMVTSGLLPQSERFDYYAGKFCFGFDKTGFAGRFTVHVNSIIHPSGTALPGNTTGRFFLFVYDDEKDHWDEPALTNEHHWQYIRNNWDTASCEERKRWATSTVDLTNRGSYTTNIVEKIRPRFWYFAFSNCGADIGHSVNYTIHAVNLLDGSESEFSIDKQESLWWHQCAAFLFVALAVVLLWSVKSSPGSGRLSMRAVAYRPLICCLILSVTLSAIGDSFLALHYRSFGLDGVGLTGLEVLGILLVSLAKAMVSLLLLMVAKGWYLVHKPHGKLLLVFLAMIILTTVCAELFGEFVHDASTTLYLYEGAPGLLILVLNTLLFVEAFRSIYIAYNNEPSSEMRWFYLSVSIASFIFFLSLPLSCILASLFAPWVRAKYVARIEVTSRFVSAALLTYCLWPSHLDIMIRSRLEETGQEELEGLELSQEQE